MWATTSEGNNTNTRLMWLMCLKLRMNTKVWSQARHSSDLDVNFKDIRQVNLMFFLTLKTPMLAGWIQIYQRKDTKVVSCVRYEPISGQHSQFIPLENPKKNKGFLVLSRDAKCKHYPDIDLQSKSTDLSLHGMKN